MTEQQLDAFVKHTKETFGLAKFCLLGMKPNGEVFCVISEGLLRSDELGLIELRKHTILATSCTTMVQGGPVN